jgi:hypothetical protein
VASILVAGDPFIKNPRSVLLQKVPHHGGWFLLITPPRTAIMMPPPNEVYSAFSFIGFVLCVIPLYWHLKGSVELKYTRGWSIHFIIVAWNVGTCMYMIWTGVGCLLQCINSIVWNKNMINRAPVYCDICMSFYVLTLSIVHSSPSPHSNPRSNRAQCRITGFFTLHQSPALQGC